jgi:hypothetical protein
VTKTLKVSMNRQAEGVAGTAPVKDISDENDMTRVLQGIN